MYERPMTASPKHKCFELKLRPCHTLYLVYYLQHSQYKSYFVTLYTTNTAYQPKPFKHINLRQNSQGVKLAAIWASVMFLSLSQEQFELFKLQKINLLTTSPTPSDSKATAESIWVSMTLLLEHSDAQPTESRFLPKTWYHKTLFWFNVWWPQ